MVEMLLYRAFELRQFDLHAYSVMANHIHVLLTPFVQMRLVTRELKGASARTLNAILNRTGQFWQAESFDHWVRNEGQFVRVKKLHRKQSRQSRPCRKYRRLAMVQRL